MITFMKKLFTYNKSLKTDTTRDKSYFGKIYNPVLNVIESRIMAAV